MTKNLQQLCVVWFLALVTCAAQSQPEPRQEPVPSASEPAAYAARTDRRIEPYKENPPAVGPAGSVVTDPSFGSRILRVTDPTADPRGKGRSLFTPSSSEQNSWNKTSTMFYVDTAGGSFLLYDFDPAAMKSHLAEAPNLPWNGEPVFSYSQPDILYGMVRREPVFQQYDVAKHKVSDIDDASKCVKLQSSDSGHSVSVSADDNRFSTTLGPEQDLNYLVYVYDKAQGCRWYNTRTGEVGGQWGPKGTVSAPDRFLIHNSRLAKSGKFLYLARGGERVFPGVGKNFVVWEIDTLNVSACDRGCRGHHVMGYSHILGPSSIGHPLDLWLRPLNHLEQSTPLIDGLEPTNGFWYDSHFSWNNVDPTDSAPVCFSTYSPRNPEGPGKPLSTDGPWENEIDCAQTDGKASRVWRFAHTYSTARNGFYSTPRGNVSQDGHFFMFTSDWQDQLGKMPEGDKYRSDVFVVELK